MSTQGYRRGSVTLSAPFHDKAISRRGVPKKLLVRFRRKYAASLLRSLGWGHISMASTALGVAHASKRAVCSGRPALLLELRWLAVLWLLLCFRQIVADTDSGQPARMSQERLRGVQRRLLSGSVDRALEERDTSAVATDVVATDRGLRQFPRVGNSTILFLHVFKVCQEQLPACFPESRERSVNIPRLYV